MNDLQYEIPIKSKKHKKILDALKARKDLWYRKMSYKRHRWTKDEERHRAYIPNKDVDSLKKPDQDNYRHKKNNKLEYVTLEIPYSYALLMSAHTYFSSVFLSRTPRLQYEEVHGHSAGSKQRVEAIMNYQTTVGKHLVPYYIWLIDTLKYGIGFVGHYWDEEHITTARMVEEQPTFAGIPLVGKKPRLVKRSREVLGYVGNRVYNIRPQDFIFDPRVPMSQFHDGEFAGRLFEMSWVNIVEGKIKGKYFNIKAAETVIRSRDTHRDFGSSQTELPNENYDTQINNSDIKSVDTKPAWDLIVNLIPRDWELGVSEKPEKWVFTVLGESVIIGARPLGEFHNEFPYDSMEYEIDGYQLYKRSLLEIVEPLENTLSWLINTHFFNIRKSLNNMFVYDPTRVESSDFKNPEAGLGIRLKPAAYGTNLNDSIKQFPVQDVTRGHLADTEIITSLGEQVVGINKQVMGQPLPSGRRTAAEARSTAGFSINRLKTQAEYMDAMGFSRHAKRLLQTTQQHYSMERWFKIAGDLKPGDPTEVIVDPQSIAGFYDVVVVDGSLPTDKFAMASLWRELMVSMSQFPELMARYDIGAIFEYTAQLSGAQNIGKFRVDIKDDSEIQRRLESGEIRPAQEAAPRGGNDSGTIKAEEGRPPGDGQISGLGPFG